MSASTAGTRRGSRWAGRGVRRGDPSPWVQVAAVSEDQTENTYAAIYEFLTANDGRAADRLGIDAGLTAATCGTGRASWSR